MPELPEVETVRRTLLPAVGARVTSVWASGKPLHLNRPVPLAELRRVTRDRTIEGMRRRGKFLLIDIADSDAAVVVHLGMSGRLRLVDPSAATAPHTHVVLALDGPGQPGRARELRYSDPRRFGFISVARRSNESAHPALAKLGLDPLTEELTGDVLHQLSRGRRGPVKTFLLDQSAIAGIGNIYASEALWQALITPTCEAGRLSRLRAGALAAAIGDVLARALGHGGTSLRDFVNADGQTGEHAHYLWVYGRDGEPCMRRGCSGRIRRTVIQGRATFHCPRCQRR